MTVIWAIIIFILGCLAVIALVLLAAVLDKIRIEYEEWQAEKKAKKSRGWPYGNG